MKPSLLAKQRVVVTGVGVCSSLGASRLTLFDALARKQSGIRERELYLEYGLPISAGAYIDELELDEIDRELEKVGYQRQKLGRNTKFALRAAIGALKDAGIEWERGERAFKTVRHGLFVSSNKLTLTDEEFLELIPFWSPDTHQLDLDLYLKSRREDEDRYLRSRQDTPTAELARVFQISGCIATHGDACAGGATAVGTAFRRIRAGKMDVALAGGVETLCSLVALAGFHQLGALAADTSFKVQERSRPFDRRRHGFVMGEGSAFLVMESLEHALSRSAMVLAEIVGYSSNLEGYKITMTKADGSEYARTIQNALKDAELSPEDVHHVNAHGTSTPVNDAAEWQAIQHVFGARAPLIPITSVKSALGHALGTSAVLEAAVAIETLRRNILPPTLNFEEPDDSVPPPRIVTEALTFPVETILSNSFGFGGTNAALLFRSYKH